MISVIIPVKNGGKTLDKCLSSILNQVINSAVEIIILDSCSTDDSVDIAKRYGSTVITIPNGTFDHGSTRNIGIGYAKGEFLYLTVQDAYLAESNQLARMMHHFDDPLIMAMTGMQAVPHDRDKNPALWFKRFSKPVPFFKQANKDDYIKLSNQEKFEMAGEWDNVNAMYRKAALAQIPFTKTEFAEDKIWATDALLAGMKIGFDPSILVYHYHHSDFFYAFNLAYTVNYHVLEKFDIHPKWPIFFRPIASNSYQILKKGDLNFKEKFYWIIHNLGRILGNYSSSLIFIFVYRFFGMKYLQQSFYFFCKNVPQGRSK